MAYNTQELFEKAITIANDKKLKYVFHTDIFQHLCIASDTYYNHFPKESNEYKEIECALKKNAILMKAGIREKWYKSKADTGGLYLYKLIGTEDERKRLSQQHHDLTSDGDKMASPSSIDLSRISTNDLLELKRMHDEQLADEEQ